MIYRILAIATLLVAACGCATVNVRALRAYANEDPDFVVALDRLDDVAEVLRMLDILLTKTGYSPGDAWVGRMAIEESRSQELIARIRERPPYDDPDLTVPVVRMYRLHLAEVVAAARRENRDRDEPADYPSLLAAMKDITGGQDVAAEYASHRAALANLEKAEEAYSEVLARYTVEQLRSSRPPDLEEADQKRDAAEAVVELHETRLHAALEAMTKVDLSRGQRKTIANDALEAFSVVLRVDLEALALMPFAVSNMVRSLKGAPAALLDSLHRRRSFESLDKLSDLPDMATSIADSLEQQLELAEGFTDALTELVAVELDDTAGFELEESVVDQVVGIALDSFHVNLNVDAEALFFAQLGGEESRKESKDSDGNVTSVTDLTGRTRRLEYAVDPIFLLGVELTAGMDFIKLPGAANLKAGFHTDRVITQGGSIDNNSSLGDAIGLQGVASDIFDFGLGLLGIQSRVKIATFDFGTVTELEVDPVTGDSGGVAQDLDGNDEIADFSLGYTQIDVGYDIAFLFSEGARKYYIEEVWLGYRYFDYRLPRILYELEGSSDYQSFVRQSPAQQLRSRYHMGGFRLRFGPSGLPFFHPYGDFGLFFGGGPVAYYFCEDTSVPCERKPEARRDREIFTGGMGAINLAFALGSRFRFTPKSWPFQAHGGLEFKMELVSGSISQEQPGSSEERSVDLGSSELFYGPTLYLRGEL